MENKIPFTFWSLDKWSYVTVIKFRAPFTRSFSGAELVYTLPFTLDPSGELIKKIESFVLEAVRTYDPQASMQEIVLNCDALKNNIIDKYSHYKPTTFTIYNNPDSKDVWDSASKGRSSWWSFRAVFNVYVNPSVDNIDFQVYENSGAFVSYKLDEEQETESLMQAIWDNVRTINEL